MKGIQVCGQRVMSSSAAKGHRCKAEEGTVGYWDAQLWCSGEQQEWRMNPDTQREACSGHLEGSARDKEKRAPDSKG